MLTRLLLLPVLACPAQAEIPEALTCSGTEPFWSLDLDATGAHFDDPEIDPIAYERVHETTAIGRFWPVAITLIARRDTAVVLISRRSCGDGMSDRAYDYSIDMLTQRAGTPVVLTGCCLDRP